jgi:hypothetical protein
VNLLLRVSDQVDSQLLESQCAVWSSRGLSDATYTPGAALHPV